MSRNLKPITGCTAPNRGLNSLSPSWLTNCTDSLTNTTNPSMNTLLDIIDAKANSKNMITVSHNCGSDFVCDGVADQVELQEAINYANTVKLPIRVINDGNYNMTSGLSITTITGVEVDFGYSIMIGTGAIPFMTESAGSSLNVFKNARLRNFIDPVVAEGSASQYDFFEYITCTGSGLISRAGAHNMFKNFYMNPGFGSYGIYAISCTNNHYDNFNIFNTGKNLVLFQANANLMKVTNSYMISTQSSNRVIEIDSAGCGFSNNYIGTGTQTTFMPIYIQGFGTVFNGNIIQHSVVSPTALFELSGTGVSSSITGNSFSGWTSGSFQQVFGATANTGVAGNSV